MSTMGSDPDAYEPDREGYSSSGRIQTLSDPSSASVVRVTRLEVHFLSRCKKNRGGELLVGIKREVLGCSGPAFLYSLHFWPAHSAQQIKRHSHVEKHTIQPKVRTGGRQVRSCHTYKLVRGRG